MKQKEYEKDGRKLSHYITIEPEDDFNQIWLKKGETTLHIVFREEGTEITTWTEKETKISKHSKNKLTIENYDKHKKREICGYCGTYQHRRQKVNVGRVRMMMRDDLEIDINKADYTLEVCPACTTIINKRQD